MDREDRRRGHGYGDRIEVLERIVGDVRIEGGIDDEIRAIDQQRVAVRCCL